MIQDLTIYLCGPINGRTDAECVSWREEAKKFWPGKCLDPMRRDYRGKELENLAQLVEDDLSDIRESHGLLVYFDRPSVGTSMEIFYAKRELKLPVVVVDTHGAGKSNPWLRHHCDKMVPSVQIALGHLLALCARRA